MDARGAGATAVAQRSDQSDLPVTMASCGASGSSPRSVTDGGHQRGAQHKAGGDGLVVADGFGDQDMESLWGGCPEVSV